MPDVNVFLGGDGIFETSVVGESFYQNNFERICGPRSEDGEELKITANLVFEDSNPYDHQAIRVDIEGKTVGYIMREHAPILRQSITSQLPVNGRLTSIQCPALIVGGWDRGDGDRGYYGVRLDMIGARLSATKPATSKSVLDTDAKNQALAERMSVLDGLLKNDLARNPQLDFTALQQTYQPSAFAPPAQLRQPIAPPDRDAFVWNIKPPGKIAGLFRRSWQAYETEMQTANARYAATVIERSQQEAARQAALTSLQAVHETEQATQGAEVAQHNQELDAFEAAYLAGDPAAICRYQHLVIERSPYPDDFPIDYALAYQATARRLVISADLPGPAIVPAVAAYKYIKSRDEIEERPRKASEIKQLYQDIVAAVALRTIHEAFRADRAGHLAVVIFDGTITAIAAGTGQRERQNMVWLQVTPQQLSPINLAQVDPSTCVKELGGRVFTKLPVAGAEEA